MGIPKFAYFISKRYPLMVKKIKEKVDVPEIDNFYLDLNSIIHNVSHGNSILISCQKRPYEDIYLDTCDTIDKLFQIIKPKSLLMISVDGVAPRTKMNQQRIRRYRKNTNITNEEFEIIKEKGLDINNQFNSDVISAGTKFMFDLTTYLKNFIIKKKKTDADWAKIEIILTGADVPGEGEHKILEYIRNFKSSDTYTKNVRHCIYGLDADLVMLALISHEPNIVLLREDTILQKKKQKLLKQKGIELRIDTDKNEEPYEFFLISVLREYLELEFYEIKNKIKFEFNMERIIDDFIFLCFFIGNDFLPNLYSFSIETGAMDYLFEFYKDCLPDLDGYITEQGKINFSRAKKIFNLLAKKELHSLDLLLYNVKDSSKKNKEKRQEQMKEQVKLLKKLKIKEKKQKLIEYLNGKTPEEQKEFKKNKRKREIQNIKNIFSKISEKLQKNYVFDDEYSKYREDPKNFEERKMKIITQATVDLFASDDEEEESNKKKKLKIKKNEKSELEKKLEEQKAQEGYKLPKIKLTVDSTIKDTLCEALKYDKYIKDENYCSDYTPNDISDSDVSDVDIKEVMLEVSKNMETITKASENEHAEDINQQFNENLVKCYIKNSEEAKAFYYKEKLHIDISTPEGKEEKIKMFNLYLQGLQWVLLYYYQGVKSWRWFYPYNYAPMISDFINFDFDENILKIFENDKSQPFSPFQSLLFILPKSSFDLLPPCYKNFPEQAPEYFPENVEIDYNGKHTPWEALVLLPFLDENKVLELEKKDRNLSKEEEIYDKWGKSFKFEKNQLNDENIKFDSYEIYQIKDYSMISNYEKKKIDCSFPTLKTLSYDYSLDNVKTYFGKNNVQKSKRMTIHPKLVVKIDEKELYNYLVEKNIFIGYPYKAFGRIEGIIYDRKYYYLYKGTMFTDKDFRFNNELEEIINSSYNKQGISLSHPDLLCNVAKFTGFENRNGKMKRAFNDKVNKNPYYVPFEITSLNSKSKDFAEFLYHFNYDYSHDGKINKNENKFNNKKEYFDKKNKNNKFNNNNNYNNNNYNNNFNINEEKGEEINKLNIRQRFAINSKFKKFPPEVRVETKKKMIIITQGPINASEYRKNRIFQNENLEEHQIYYYKNPNSKTNINNPNLIIK